jgi:hypothetical protein
MKPPNRSPDDWVAPDWHSDFGDPVVELVHLRAFASQLLATLSSTCVSLELPEPGLMYVRVQTAGGTTSAVYSIPAKGG